MKGSKKGTMVAKPATIHTGRNVQMMAKSKEPSGMSTTTGKNSVKRMGKGKKGGY